MTRMGLATPAQVVYLHYAIRILGPMARERNSQLVKGKQECARAFESHLRENKSNFKGSGD